MKVVIELFSRRLLKLKVRDFFFLTSIFEIKKKLNPNQEHFIFHCVTFEKKNAMGKELERRSFLGKLTLGISSLAVLPLFGWAKN